MSITTVSDDAEDGRIRSPREPSNQGQGQGQGRLWDMDQRIDPPLGVEADHVRSMYRNQVRLRSTVLTAFEMAPVQAYGLSLSGTSGVHTVGVNFGIQGDLVRAFVVQAHRFMAEGTFLYLALKPWQLTTGIPTARKES